MFARTCYSSSLVGSTVSAQNGLPPLTDDQNITITFYSYNLASAGVGADGTQQLISEFEALHPNITVEGVGTPSTEIISRTQADLAAGNPPDVARLVFNDLDFIVNNFNATSLEQIVPAEEWVEHIAGFHPRRLAVGADQRADLRHGIHLQHAGALHQHDYP